MKKHFVWFVALMILSIASAPVMAQSDQSVIVAPQIQDVTGQAESSFNIPVGTQLVGGEIGGSANTSFQASDPDSAFGSALAKGDGNGSQTVTPTSVFSSTQSKVDSIGYTEGAGPGKLSVAGGPAQSTWGTIGGSMNFASAYETSSGQYSGTMNGLGPLAGAGAGFSNGWSQGTQVQGPGSSQSTVETAANSGASTTMPAINTAAAYGIAGLQSMIGGPGAFAEADGLGTATSASAGGLSALSSIDVKGNTLAAMGPNSVNASSLITAQASGANTGNVSTPPPCGCGH